MNYPHLFGGSLPDELFINTRRYLRPLLQTVKRPILLTGEPEFQVFLTELQLQEIPKCTSPAFLQKRTELHYEDGSSQPWHWFWTAWKQKEITFLGKDRLQRVSQRVCFVRFLSAKKERKGGLFWSCGHFTEKQHYAILAKKENKGKTTADLHQW